MHAVYDKYLNGWLSETYRVYLLGFSHADLGLLLDYLTGPLWWRFSCRQS